MRPSVDQVREKSSMRETVPRWPGARRPFSLPTAHEAQWAKWGLTVRAVSTVEELKAACGLVHREYVRQGYADPTEGEWRLSMFHALPQTTTFIALAGPRLIGTLTLIPDSPLGLPMDDAYRAALDQARQRGRRLAEVSMLAIDREWLAPRGLPRFRAVSQHVVLALFKAMFDEVRARTRVTDLVACCHPRHATLYAWLRFRSLGAVERYERANGCPAEGLTFNVETGRRLVRRCPVMRFFYGKRGAARSLAQRLALAPDHLAELFVRTTRLFEAMTPAQLEYVAACYPRYPFSRILQAA